MKVKRVFYILGVIVILGIGYWLISPLFIERRASETVEDITQNENTNSSSTQEPTVILSGSFSGLDFHNAEGTAKLLKINDKYFVRFEDDFRVTNGPDLFVHFGKNGEYVKSARLGSLKGSVGSQNYEVPEGIDPNEYNEVWVWCRAFSVPFGKAILN